ncbi:hypothetical protein NA57DRAFT_56863 [Rhizodiscina lignyota]|uniref:Uncharacterized protein n=1 Tax=Rhizodiscina lignyota TaxID=1504668 RepID=A0A9P4IE64_9PEZI|nr:hypothetical protein NA57DRAFT_56863 [Rhizodiscina lignyota]
MPSTRPELTLKIEDHMPPSPSFSNLTTPDWIIEYNYGESSMASRSPIFRDPFPGPRFPPRRPYSPPISPKTSSNPLVAYLAQVVNGEQADSVSDASSDSERTISAPKTNDLIFNGKTARILLPNDMTMQLQSYLLARRRFINLVKETDQKQSELDTQGCDLLDHIIELESTSLTPISLHHLALISPRDVEAVDNQRRLSSALLATARMRRQNVLQQKKDLQDGLERLRQFMQEKRRKLLDGIDGLDSLFEVNGLLPRTRMPNTPGTMLSMSPYSGHIPIALDSSDDDLFEEEDALYQKDPGTYKNRVTTHVASSTSKVVGSSTGHDIYKIVDTDTYKIPITPDTDETACGTEHSAGKNILSPTYSEAASYAESAFTDNEIGGITIPQEEDDSKTNVSRIPADKQDRISRWRDQVWEGTLGNAVAIRFLCPMKPAITSVEQDSKVRVPQAKRRMFSFSRSKATFDRPEH